MELREARKSAQKLKLSRTKTKVEQASTRVDELIMQLGDDLSEVLDDFRDFDEDSMEIAVGARAPSEWLDRAYGVLDTIRKETGEPLSLYAAWVGSRFASVYIASREEGGSHAGAWRKAIDQFKGDGRGVVALAMEDPVVQMVIAARLQRTAQSKAGFVAYEIAMNALDSERKDQRGWADLFQKTVSPTAIRDSGSPGSHQQNNILVNIDPSKLNQQELSAYVSKLRKEVGEAGEIADVE